MPVSDVGQGHGSEPPPLRLVDRGASGPLAALGQRPVRPRNLTPRELEVVELVVEGLENEEIAEQLMISPHTVQSHVSNALAKLQVRTRTQLAVAVLRRGLVPLHPGEPPAADERGA
ncbi:LuxR C-terminal-related transcriptional regulator [Patulibacter defluvii]|uniref:LuxR C-terminal-related transcriptional regulator n=1 Tax=Patulibacter defluvii TaxID=3095358 RepID=UPI002A74AEF1|nr:LuxR C-terminal-related transcriptional regulator [Patulibacter sp. DM4]